MKVKTGVDSSGALQAVLRNLNFILVHAEATNRILSEKVTQYDVNFKQITTPTLWRMTGR